MRRIALVVLALAGQAAFAADVSIRTESGRSVMRRGEAVDVAVRVQSPGGPATVEFWLDGPAGRIRLGADQMPQLEAGTADFTYRIDTGAIRPGTYRLIARAKLGDQQKEAGVSLEIVSDVRLTNFTIIHMGIPGWVLPTNNLAADSARYHFNFQNANIADCWSRGGKVELTGAERNAEDMVRHGIDFMKYPTVFGWGLAHRPIRGGASWYDPDIIEISAQLTQYHTQACRRFPNFVGLNPIDEPGVSWTNEFLAAAFKKKTGMDAPAKEDREKDLKRYVAYQTFRNYTLAQFHDLMKPRMLEVDPRAKLSCQTFAGILTRAGLYPSGNTFMDIQSTHTYDHWPTSNNWIAFALNLRRANRNAFWKRPLWTFTGCYGIMPDQWRASWSLGMSEKLDGHGYFLGAGEVPEGQPWAEYGLAEMVRINRICEKYGDFFLALEKPVEPLALWYSLEQAAASDPESFYEQEVIGAFYALKRAHFPVTVVTDEDLRAGLLKEHKVLMLVGIDYAPDDLRGAVEKFRAGGGKLVADRTTSAFDKVVRMDTDFREFAAGVAEVEKAWYEKRQETSMRLRRDIFAEKSILRNLRKVKQALLPLVERPAYAQSPDTFLAVQRYGDARYVFVANEASVYRHPNVEGRWITMQESVPATDTITMPFARGKAVYDLWTGEELKLDANGAVDLRMLPAGLRVLCVYPTALPKQTFGMTVVGPWPVKLDMRLEPAADASGVVPALIELRDPNGKIALKQYTVADAAARSGWTHRSAANDSGGTWRARYVNLLTGEEQVAEVNLPEPRADAQAIVSRLAPAISFDDRAYAEFLSRKPLWIVPGKGCEPIAEELAKLLGAEIRNAEDIRKTDTYPDLLDPEKNKGVWMMRRWEPLSFTTGADLVLVGTPENNILIKDVNESGILRRVVHPSTLGKGEGMVQYAWSPFDPDKDAVIVAGYDDAGLKAASARFLAIAGLTNAADGREQPRRLRADLAREGKETPAAAQAVEEIAPAARLRVDGSVRKLAAGGGLVAAGTMDSRLHVFDSSGAKLWERDFDYRVLGVDVSPDGRYVTAAAFPRTHVFDRNGVLQFFSTEKELTQDDTEGLAVQAGPQRLIKGTWPGTVKAYDANGKLLWSFPPEPDAKKDEEGAPEPKKPEPIGSVRAVAVLADGNIAVAGMKSLVVLDSEGKEVLRKKINRLQDVCAAGDKIVAASFKKKLYLLDAKGETLWEKDTPDFIMAADASADGSTIAAALFGGEVIVYDAEGKVTRRAKLPFDATLTGIAVGEAAKAIWLSTWEGDVIKWAVE